METVIVSLTTTSGSDFVMGMFCVPFGVGNWLKYYRRRISFLKKLL